MSIITRYTKRLSVILTLGLLFLPLISQAQATPANFENPLDPVRDVRVLIQNLIIWLVGLSALIALLALVVGGMRLIVGGFDNEQEAAKAKRIITWAVIGLVVVAMAAGILSTLSDVLDI